MDGKLQPIDQNSGWGVLVWWWGFGRAVLFHLLLDEGFTTYETDFREQRKTMVEELLLV